MQCVVVHCSVLQNVAECQSVLQCVAVHCSALRCIAVHGSALQCVAVHFSVFECVAVCCSVLQCVALWCHVIMMHVNMMRLKCVTATDGGDRTYNKYDCQNFHQVFVGVPINIQHVFSGVPKFSNT